MARGCDVARRLLSSGPVKLAAALAAVTLVAAAPASARADGHYFSMGVGPTQVEDELAELTGDGVRLRFAVGHRWGNLAAEGFLAPEFLGEHEQASGVGYGVDVRYILPLTAGVQAYVRGSMSKLSLEDTSFDRESFSLGGADERHGRGLGGGVGIQLRGKVRALGFLYWPFFFLPLGPKTNAALTIDHGVDFYRLHDPSGRNGAVDAKLTRLTIGFQVGKDF
jgi:hypothetical protein